MLSWPANHVITCRACSRRRAYPAVEVNREHREGGRAQTSAHRDDGVVWRRPGQLDQLRQGRDPQHAHRHAAQRTLGVGRALPARDPAPGRVAAHARAEGAARSPARLLRHPRCRHGPVPHAVCRGRALGARERPADGRGAELAAQGAASHAISRTAHRSQDVPQNAPSVATHDRKNDHTNARLARPAPHTHTTDTRARTSSFSTGFSRAARCARARRSNSSVRASRAASSRRPTRR